MRFQFRFTSLLDLYRRNRDEMGGRVGEANAAIHKVDEQIEVTKKEAQQLLVEDAATRIGTISVDNLIAKGRYQMQLAARIHSLTETRSKLEQELERRQAKLREAETEVKKFERMKEIDYANFQKEVNRREQAEIDELNSSRFAMAIRNRSEKES